MTAVIGITHLYVGGYRNAKRRLFGQISVRNPRQFRSRANNGTRTPPARHPDTAHALIAAMHVLAQHT